MEELLRMIRRGDPARNIDSRIWSLQRAGVIGSADMEGLDEALAQHGYGSVRDLKSDVQTDVSRDALKELGLRMWGGIQGPLMGTADNLLNAVLPGRPLDPLQQAYEREIPFAERMATEALGDIGLMVGTGGISAIPSVSKRLAGQGFKQIPKRVAGKEAAEEVAKRSLLAGGSPERAATAASDATDWVRMASQARRSPEGPAAIQFADEVAKRGLVHPGSFGAREMAGRTATGDFPVSRLLMGAGETAWNTLRHGKIRPGRFEDLSPRARTFGDVLGGKRQLRFAEEGGIFGGLQGFGRTDREEGESLSDYWKRASRNTAMGIGIGGASGVALGNLIGLGQYGIPRIQHAKRPETSEQVLRKGITDLSGVGPGAPTRRAVNETVGRTEAEIPGLMDTPFTSGAGDVAGTLGDLRRRGAGGILPEIAAGATRDPRQPMRVGGLVGVGSYLGQRNRDQLGELRGAFDEYVDQFGDVATRDADVADELTDMAMLRLGDVPRRPLAGAAGAEGRFGLPDLETPAAGHVLREGLPATRKIHDLLSYTEGEAGLLPRAVQEYMPESVTVRGKPADRVATYGEVSELIDRYGERQGTSLFGRELQQAGSREQGFENLMDLKRQGDVAKRQRTAIQKAEQDSKRLDRPDAFEAFMKDNAADPDALDAYGRHYFESLVERLERDPSEARQAFQQLLGRSSKAREGIVQMVRESPAVTDSLEGMVKSSAAFKGAAAGMTEGASNQYLERLVNMRKQNLINEISLIANTEATLSQGATSVIDFLMRRAAGVSTRWAAVGVVSSDMGGASGRGMRGRGVN